MNSTLLCLSHDEYFSKMTEKIKRQKIEVQKNESDDQEKIILDNVCDTMRSCFMVIHGQIIRITKPSNPFI